MLSIFERDLEQVYPDCDLSRSAGGSEKMKRFPRFKIMSLNTFSLLPHLDELCIFVDSEKPHIICINETKLDDSIDDSLVHIDGYAIIRKDRNKHGGGVALYIHKNINFEPKRELMCDEIESISVQIKNGKLNHSSSHQSIGHLVNQSVTLKNWNICLVNLNHRTKSL